MIIIPRIRLICKGGTSSAAYFSRRECDVALPRGNKKRSPVSGERRYAFVQRKSGDQPCFLLCCDQDYSFTPPTATPAMMNLEKQKYTIISGMAVRVRPR